MASILTGHVTHWACLGCSGSAYTTACSSSCQYPATSHSHWRGVPMAQGLLRAGPSGEEQRTPHYSVPISPQYPQEIGLPTLPVFQGIAVSSERFSQLFLPVKCSGAERLTAPLGVPRVAGSVVSCRASASWHRAIFYTCSLNVSLHRIIISIPFPLIYTIWWPLTHSARSYLYEWVTEMCVLVFL